MNSIEFNNEFNNENYLVNRREKFQYYRKWLENGHLCSISILRYWWRHLMLFHWICIIKRKLHGGLKILLVMKTVFYSLATLIRKILLLPLENKIHIFAPSCNIPHVCSTDTKQYPSFVYSHNLLYHLSHIRSWIVKAIFISFWSSEIFCVGKKAWIAN